MLNFDDLCAQLARHYDASRLGKGAWQVEYANVASERVEVDADKMFPCHVGVPAAVKTAVGNRAKS